MTTTPTWNTSTIDATNANHVPRLLYTREQAAYLLSLSIRTLDSLLLTKELRGVKIGRCVRIPAAALETFCKRDHSTVQ
jgi:excisionase family DNA binding protein